MTTKNAPALTDQQRQQYLAKAMEARHERAVLKAELKEGKITIANVFELADKGNETARRLPCKQLVSSLPGYGFRKTQDLMRRLGISEARRVRGLGRKQREALIEVLG